MAVTCTKLAKLKRLSKEKMINIIKLSYLKLNKKNWLILSFAKVSDLRQRRRQNGR